MAILFTAASTEAVSQQCFDEAPSVREGVDLYDLLVPTRLTSRDKAVIDQLFERLEGRWSGDSKGYFCRGRKGAARKEADGYRIDMNATRDNSDVLLLTSNMTSKDNSSVRTEKLRLFLSNDTLRVGVDDQGGEVQIQQMPRDGGPIEFLHKVIFRSGADGGVTVTEILRRISVSATSVIIEYEVYQLGVFASGSTWKLKRK